MKNFKLLSTLFIRQNHHKFLVNYIHSTCVLLKNVIELVPALGESITEGTISKWMKNVGDQIQPDDVVAVVETDKVTVDIKATLAGVLVKQHALDNVEVGKPLYEIEVNESDPIPIKRVDMSTDSTKEPLPKEVEQHSHHRVPLIKFIGKRDHSKVAHVEVNKIEKVAIFPNPKPVKIIKSGNGVNFQSLKGGAWYGRPKLSLKEIEAIESGGATLT